MEYPNYVAFDKPALTMYCFTSRSAALLGESKLGNTKVYFDDLEAGVWNGSSYDTIMQNSFESPNVFDDAPYDFSAAVNPLSSVEEENWYSENAEALLKFVTSHARTGKHSLECDASLLK